jgi:predicted HTH transcriptional regulator
MNILYIPGLVPEVDKEKYSLNLAEYNYHVNNFRTKQCPYLRLNGSCELNEVCSYAHEKVTDASLENYRKAVSNDNNSSPHMLTASALSNGEAEKCTVRIGEGEEAYIVGRKTDFKEDSKHAFIGLSDSNQVEKKLKSLQDFMCAFSNANGGTLYLGIKKSGQITGIVCGRQGMDRIRLMIDNNVTLLHYNIENEYCANATSILSSEIQSQKSRKGNQRQVYSSSEYVRR